MADYVVDANGKITKVSDSWMQPKKKKKKTSDYVVDINGNVSKVSDDIAPVKEKKDNKLDFFQGVEINNAWDVGKAILGTAGDAALEIGKGVASMGEGLLDLTRYGMAAIGDKYGDPEYANKLRENAKKNTVEQITERADDFLEQYSVLGNTSDAIFGGIGQVGSIILTGGLAGAAGLGTAGATALTTGVMGASGMGSGMSQAYQEGATDKEAMVYGAIAGGAEALSELMFGGLGKAVNAVGLNKGLLSLDDALAKKIAGKFSSQIAKNFAEFGVKASAESVEEVVSGIASAIGKWKTYKSDEELLELLKDENLLEQAVVGFVTSGISQSGLVPGMRAGSLVESNKTGRDFIDGMTDTERKVVDKETENRIARQEKYGAKLSDKEKAEIRDAVIEDMDSGVLSAESIASVLDEKGFDEYVKALEDEESMQSEFDTLNDMKPMEMTGKQSDRKEELRRLIEERKQSDQHSDKLGRNLLHGVEEATKTNAKFANTLKDLEQRNKKYQADPNRTFKTVGAKKTYQNIIESGKFDNGKASRDLAELMLKSAEGRDYEVVFTDTKQLEESIKNGNPYNIKADPKKINAFEYSKKRQIVINMDTGKALNSLLGHETTHTLEKLKNYGDIQKWVIDFAKSKGEYETRYKDAEKRYNGVKANIDREIVADMIGDYIFTDRNFAKRLSTEKPNVLRKIYDDIKYLWKLATAGSHEKRQLERVKREIENIWKEAGQKTTEASDGAVKYSLDPVDAVQPKSNKWQRTATTEEAMAQFPNMWNVAAEESEVRNPTQITTTVKSYRKIYDFLQSEGFDGTILDASSGLGYGTRAGIEEYGFDVEDIEPYPDKGYNPKYTDYSALDKKYDVIISNAVLNVLPQDQRDALAVKMGEMLNDGGRMFINVRGKDVESLAKTGKNIHLGNMEWIETVKGSYQKGFTKDELKAYLEDALGDGFTVEKSNMFGAVSVVVTKNGDTKYSLSDSDGRQLSPAVAQRFKNSKAVDENGNLKVLYHGTASGEFTIFDKQKGSVEGDFGSGFYFTDNDADVSEHYEGGGPDFENKVARRAEQIEAEEDIDYEEAKERARAELYKGSHKFEVYLNIENPAIVGETMLFDGESYLEMYNEEDFDDYDEYIAEVEQAFADDVENIIWEVEKNVDVLNTDGLAGLIYDAYYDGGVDIEYFKDGIAQLFLEDSDGNLVGNEVTRQIIESLGYDGIIDPTVSTKWNMNMEAGTTHYIVFKPNQIKSVTNENPTDNPDIRYSLSDIDGTPIEQERISADERDIRYSIRYAPNIEEGQRNFLDDKRKKSFISAGELAQAQEVTRAMVDVMMKYSSILPEDKIGKVLTKNGSYDRSVENTTICVRTLAYNEFVDKVQEEIGRPLTQMESFLVSQKLYDIATEPQCLYCYVSLDRKSFNEMLLRYMEDRDTVIDKYKKSDKMPETIDALYEEFLRGRKPTKEMRKRFDDWISYVDNGTQLLSLADIATEANQSAINAAGGTLAEQLKEARKYAQSASWSKIQKNYVAYRDEILKLGDRVVKNLNEHYGLRWYSFSDYSAAFIVENMQQITDASIRGLKGLSYTKDTDFAEIFAPSGMNINVSVFVNQDADGNFFIDEKQSADFERAKELRGLYPNVGIVATVTNDEALRWAASQDWSDVIIPFHIVRTGTDVAEYYKWLNYTSESGDTIKDKNLWDAYVDSLNLNSDSARKKVSKNIYPSEHKNDKTTYLTMCENRGLTPRFARFAGEDWYMKLVNETRLSADESVPLKPTYNLEAAQTSFQKFVEKGGYEGGWYNDGVDVDAEASIVAHDVLAGKKANEVDYGRQDMIAPESIMARRKKVRSHGKYSLAGDAPTREYGNWNIYGKDIKYQDIAPVQEATPVQTAVNEADYAPMNVAQANERDEMQNNLQSLDDTRDMPPEEEYMDMSDAEDPFMDTVAPAPKYAKSPFADKDIKEVGNRKVKAYMYENPEVKPFFQAEAQVMLGELENSIKGEKHFNDQLYYDTNGEQGWFGTTRETSYEIAYLLDTFKYTYADIEKGLKAIIEDNGKENNAVSKRIEFLLDERLRNGYTYFMSGDQIPANQEYINLLNEKNVTEYNDQAFEDWVRSKAAEDEVYLNDIAPVAEEYEAIKPQRPKKQPKMVRLTDEEIIQRGGDIGPGGKQRKWVGTSTDSEVVDRKVLPSDLDQDVIHYQPISNKKTLGNANARLDNMGYETSVQYFNSQFANKKVSLDDIALGERLIQEAVKQGDYATAGDLIQNVSILGTELGQKVQALSIIKRLTPEGQLKMLQKTVERGKTKGDKAYDGVVITQEMIDKILSTYGKDGTFDQDKLNGAVEDVKKQIADQMKVTKLDKANAWRYLSMLGNPKTHIRNLVSNVAMRGTMIAKDAVARTIEDIAPVQNRTKTWKFASDYVRQYAKKTAIEMKDEITGDSKYSDDTTIKQKREIFKNKILNGVYEFNSNMLEKEDWWFSRPAFSDALRDYLTANGIRTAQDIADNPKIVAKAKAYAVEQAQIATFRQYSWLANKIGEIERKNAATNIAVGAILPFKKTPVNIAKTGLNYSPLGFMKTLTYDVSEVKKGNMEASTLVDHLAQNVTGSAITLVGYMLASSGLLSGAGDDDKEGKYDYQLGEQAYAVNIGGKSYSLSWLSPVAMPLFVGANAFEQLVEGKEWNGDVVVETLAQTLDPLSEMSFLSSLDSVLSSYDSGVQKFAGIGETMAQNYITQFAPTAMSQVATVLDDTKRSTKVAGDSGFKFFDETLNKLKYKIPFLRETLEPSTDIWGNEVKQTENVMTRAFETFIAPYSKRDNIATQIDGEIKTVYGETGDTGVIPSIPNNYTSYEGEKYNMSASEYTDFKKAYGQIANSLLGDLFKTKTYQSAVPADQAEMIGKVYDYARDEAKRTFFKNHGVNYTNAESKGVKYYKENAINGAIKNDMSIDEYSFYEKYPEKYAFFNEIGISYQDYSSADKDGKEAYNWAFENPTKYKVSKLVTDDVIEYRKYTGELSDLSADKDGNGKTIQNSRKRKVVEYLNNLDIDYGARLILYKREYEADDTYNADIVEYLNSLDYLSYEDIVEILTELNFKVRADGTVTWD